MWTRQTVQSEVRPAVRSTGVALQRTCSCGQHTSHGECDECRRNRQRRGHQSGQQTVPAGRPAAVLEAGGHGEGSVQPRTGTYRGSRFDHDFTAVRTHSRAHGGGYADMTITGGAGITHATNTTHYANCEGVSIEGHTDANYRNSFSRTGSPRPAENCTDCAEDDACIRYRGTIVSKFKANPAVTLPSVPSGLDECEEAAVRQFINTTLRAHEQEHVAAFNTYNGTVRTPFTYTGCESGLDDYAGSRHEAIASSRQADSDAASAALDPFNPPIPCDCPEPESEPESETESEAETGQETQPASELAPEAELEMVTGV